MFHHTSSPNNGALLKTDLQKAIFIAIGVLNMETLLAFLSLNLSLNSHSALAYIISVQTNRV
jgi:hypothetical protein